MLEEISCRCLSNRLITVLKLFSIASTADCKLSPTQGPQDINLKQLIEVLYINGLLCVTRICNSQYLRNEYSLRKGSANQIERDRVRKRENGKQLHSSVFKYPINKTFVCGVNCFLKY